MKIAVIIVLLMLPVMVLAETRHLISGIEFRALGQRGIFINVARGTVVDPDALITALPETILWSSCRGGSPVSGRFV